MPGAPEPFIPQFEPWFDDAEARAVHEYMRSGGWVTEFRKTVEFGEAIAAFTGAKYCSILSNGTVSLTCALQALGVGDGHEVIVPAYTMVASANAVLMAFGARPVFADVEPLTFGLDAASVRSVVSARTRAVVLVSINGRYPESLKETLALCQARGIAVVEDAAQSLGSWHDGTHAGRFGACGSFSFSAPKIITTGQGGALITDDETLFREIEKIRNFGRESAGIDKHITFGANFKFTDLQAVVGLEQMRKLPDRIERKRRTFRALQDALADVPEVQVPATAADVTPWFNDILVEDREALAASLKAQQIGTRPFYPAVHTQAPYRGASGAFPAAEDIARKGLWLPSSSQLRPEHVERLVGAIRRHYGR